jgi:hypothetical protein
MNRVFIFAPTCYRTASGSERVKGATYAISQFERAPGHLAQLSRKSFNRFKGVESLSRSLPVAVLFRSASWRSGSCPGFIINSLDQPIHLIHNSVSQHTNSVNVFVMQSLHFPDLLLCLSQSFTGVRSITSAACLFEYFRQRFLGFTFPVIQQMDLVVEPIQFLG